MVIIYDVLSLRCIIILLNFAHSVCTETSSQYVCLFLLCVSVNRLDIFEPRSPPQRINKKAEKFFFSAMISNSYLVLVHNE